MSFPYSASSRFLPLSRSAGLSMAVAAVLAFSGASDAGAQQGCKGEACGVLTPLLRALTGPGPNCRQWVDVRFWKRAGAKDVQRCIARGYRVGARQRGGLTPLHLAAHVGKADAVKALVEAGADMEAQGSEGSTPLHAAAFAGNAGTLRTLIAAGARIEAQEGLGRTPLHAAAFAGRPETARILLSSGARTDARDRHGDTPAELAAFRGKANVARVIRAAGAQAAARAEREAKAARAAPAPDRTATARRSAAGAGGGCGGWLAADFWRRAGEADVRRCLAAGSRLDARNAHGSTPLHWAAYVDNAAAVKALVDAGAKIDVRDARDRTPAHSAASGGAEAAARALLAAGADVSARSADGRTPAEEARSKNNTRVAGLLDGSGGRTAAAPTPQKPADSGTTGRTAQARQSAADRPDCKGWLTVDFWRRAGPADINRCLSKDKGLYDSRRGTGEHAGSRPLHLAAYADNLAAVKFLLTGPNTSFHLDTKNASVGYPLDVAVKAGSIGVIEPLVAAVKRHRGTTQLGAALRMAAKFGKTESVKELLRVGVKVNSKDRYGSTALHEAAKNGHAEVVKTLLAGGANIEAKTTSDNRTALHEAAQSGHAEVAKALLAGGANIEAKTSDNRTALSIAEKEGKTRAASVLTAAGGKTHVSCEDLMGLPSDYREFWKRAGGADVRRCLAYTKKKYRDGGLRRDTLHVAAVYGRPEAVKAVIAAGAKVDAKIDCRRCGRGRGSDGTALHSAVLAGRAENVKALVAAGADIAVRDRHQRSPLELATADGKAEAAEILSGAKEKLHERMSSVARDCGNWMKTDFWQYGSAADVKRCVRAGKKVGARDGKGWTRLHFAAAYGNVEMMKALIASGAKVDAREEEGGTPLHIAAAHGTPGAVDVLLDANANAKAKSKNGLSPFDVAKKRNKRVQGSDAYWRLNEALHE